MTARERRSLNVWARTVGKYLAYDLGYSLERDPFKHRVLTTMRERGITDVLDIGANTGQFGALLRKAKVTGRIVSVEPQGEACAALARRAAADPRWDVERAAVSSAPGTVTLHVSENSVSSSVLPILDSHTEAAPSSGYVAAEEVPATTVDDLVERHGLTPETTMLKLDVQGYERAVLDGAAGTLERFWAVRTELSVVALYEGQALLPDLLQLLDAKGFELWVLEPGFVDPVSHRQLQVDGTFFRRR